MTDLPPMTPVGDTKQWPNFAQWHAHSAREASDLQIELLEQYTGHRGDRVCRVFSETWNKTSRAFIMEEEGEERRTRSNDPVLVAQYLKEATLWLASNGQTLWLSSDIRSMISQAATQFGDETLRSDDPPYSEGFIWLPVALDYWSHEDFADRPNGVLSDEFPDGVPLVAIGWVRNTTGVLVYCFTATSEAAFKNGSPRVLLVDLWQWDFDRPWDTIETEPGQVLSDIHGNEIHAVPWVAHTRRFLVALWRFMAQEIVYVERENDRPTRRRAERAGKHSTFSTIKLRRIHRPTSEEHVPGTVHWTCQWIQKGHVRTLYRGTDKQRKIWVSPGVKGPEGLPMKISHNVVSVER